MVKKILMVLSMIMVIVACGINVVCAQQASGTDKPMDMSAPAASDTTAKPDDTTTIKGVITSVAEDGSSLVMNNETLTIDPDLKDYMNIEAGDSVELTIKTVDGKKVIVDFDYVDLE